VKKFTFPLARVLDWRRTQLQVAESKLEQLYAELRAIETRLRDTERAREQSGRELIAMGSATGAELAALDRFRQVSREESAKLGESASASRQRIGAQMQAVLLRQREVRLLEHLEARKLAAWNTELAREVDREASELHLVKWRSR
jgi:flagellar export protein FliJ